jgi:hypothetical protein
MGAKISILKAMVDTAIDTSVIRNYINDDGPDDFCHYCRKSDDDYLYCTICESTYHLECAGYKNNTNNVGNWKCDVCKKNITIFNNLKSPFPQIEGYDEAGFLGFDRLGQRYRYLSKRIWVELLNGDFLYYSDSDKVEKLLESLDSQLEEKLIANISKLKIGRVRTGRTRVFYFR